MRRYDPTVVVTILVLIGWLGLVIDTGGVL